MVVLSGSSEPLHWTGDQWKKDNKRSEMAEWRDGNIRTAFKSLSRKLFFVYPETKCLWCLIN